jgi:hypothetical protein
MMDWRQQLDDVIKSQGFEKKVPELSTADFGTIQEFLEQKARPAFENICDQLNTFQNLRAEVMAAASPIHSSINGLELMVHKMGQPRLTYRLNFCRRVEGIFVFGEYSTPNIYGENTRFHKTAFDRLLTHAWEDDVAEDFSAIMKVKF